MIGILTRETGVKYIDKQIAITRFSIALGRGQEKNGEDRGAEFLNILVFGRIAENCENYLLKVSRVGVQGYIQTGRDTNKDDNKVYIDRVEFQNSKNYDCIVLKFKKLNVYEMEFVEQGTRFKCLRKMDDNADINYRKESNVY